MGEGGSISLTAAGGSSDAWSSPEISGGKPIIDERQRRRRSG
jgi:hypothetical protein